MLEITERVALQADKLRIHARSQWSRRLHGYPTSCSRIDCNSFQRFASLCRYCPFELNAGLTHVGKCRKSALDAGTLKSADLSFKETPSYVAEGHYTADAYSGFAQSCEVSFASFCARSNSCTAITSWRPSSSGWVAADVLSMAGGSFAVEVAAGLG